METEVKRKVDLNQVSQTRMQQADDLFEAKNYAEAIKKYKEVVSTNPDYIPALNKLASSLQQTNAEEQATKVLKRIIRLNPDNSRVYARVAKLEAKKGDLQNAIIGYKKAISINHEQPDWVFIGLGKALRSLKQAEVS